MSALLSAFRVLTDPADTGAVCLGPAPRRGRGGLRLSGQLLRQAGPRAGAGGPPTQEAIQAAAQAIRQARKPLLVCGGGVRYAEAHQELRHFVEALNIPFGETQAGKSALVWDHPLNLGGIGVTGLRGGQPTGQGSRLDHRVGTRYTDFTTSSKWLFREDARFVNISTSPLPGAEAGRGGGDCRRQSGPAHPGTGPGGLSGPVGRRSGKGQGRLAGRAQAAGRPDLYPARTTCPW